MAHQDSGWRPKLGVETYNGYEIYDHGIGPHEFNHGKIDGVIEFEGIEFDRAASSDDS